MYAYAKINAGVLLVDNITIDQMGEMDFRRSVEDMLRCGRADEAADKLRGLLEGCAGEGKILPGRFLTVASDDVSLKGWDLLALKIEEYDRESNPISAISIAITDPLDDGVSPDAQGRLAPSIRTGYFSDSAYPFSKAERSDLLEGYSLFGCEWRDDYEGTDTTLSVEGIDDLYGAIARLDEKVSREAEPSREDIRAGTLGACYVAVLIHQATRDAIRRNGLPRPLCIMAGYHEVYPFFDAPVMSCEEYLADGVITPVSEGPEPITVDAVDIDEAGMQGAASGYGSLTSVGKAKSKKKPVIALDAADAESAARYNQLAAAEHMNEQPKTVSINALTGLTPPDGGKRVVTPVEPAESETFDDWGEPDDWEDSDDRAGTDDWPEPVDQPEPADQDTWDTDDIPTVPGTPEPEAEPLQYEQADDIESPVTAENLSEFGESPSWDETGDQSGPEIENEIADEGRTAGVDIEARSTGDSGDIADFTDAPLPRIHEEPEDSEEAAPPWQTDVAEEPAELLPPPEPAGFAEPDEAPAPVEPVQIATSAPAAPAYKPDFDNRTHNLRARLVKTPQPRKTMMDRVFAWLRRLTGG